MKTFPGHTRYFVSLLILLANSVAVANDDTQPHSGKSAIDKAARRVVGDEEAKPKQGGGEKANGEDADDGDKGAPKPLAEIVDKCERRDGLFTLLRDRETGEVYLLVKRQQLGKEFIYFTYTENGVPQAGHFRGKFHTQRIFTIERDHRRLRFSFQPTRYYFDPNHALRRAAEANISPAVLAAEKIVAWDKADDGNGDDKRDSANVGQFIVRADNIFLAELFQQVKPSRDPDDKSKEFRLGELSKDKSRFVSLRSYPKNSDLVVEYVYEDLAPARRAERGEGVTDSRYVTIKMQHSLVEMPENDYQPRRDDPRVGYFIEQVDDLTSTSATPYRDVINRWHLKKKNPDAELSPPVEPIVWWLENTTPREFRETIRNAVLAWNEAFEEAGFKDAVDVRVQPDDAAWDAGDLRYNVLRWTSSPDPPFGGYGPSFVNPRTGQILGADIMLEWVFVTKRLRMRRLFADDAVHGAGARGFGTCGNGCACQLSDHLHASTLFGRRVLDLRGAAPVDVDALVKQSLYYLVLHEVGHTLGLMHNFRSSQLHSPDAIHDLERTKELGVTASVMEYPPINLSLPGKPQGLYYTTRPGPYDKWAIKYGYSPAAKEPQAEEQRLQKILARSTQPELAFGNDADDMRRAGNGIDPRVMIYDLTDDAISWSDDRIALVRQTIGKLEDGYDEDTDKSYHELRDSFFLLMLQHELSAKVVSRYVGGIYIDRAKTGQEGATQPYRPVPLKVQRHAMKVLAKRVFAPNAFKFSPQLLAHLQQQRRGFDHWGKTEDVKVHDHVLRIQRAVLDQLLHPRVLARISDSQLYGNKYALKDCLADLTDAIFKADIAEDVNTVRQNLQAEYVKRLIAITGSAGDGKNGKQDSKPAFGYLAQSMSQHQLREIHATLDPNVGVDVETLAHRDRLKLMIDRALAVERR